MAISSLYPWIEPQGKCLRTGSTFYSLMPYPIGNLHWNSFSKPSSKLGCNIIAPILKKIYKNIKTINNLAKVAMLGCKMRQCS